VDSRFQSGGGGVEGTGGGKVMMYSGDDYYGDEITSPLYRPQAELFTFTRVSSAEYDGGSRLGTIEAPYAALVAVLGEPHKNTDANYPDDDYKTDVCWSVRSSTGAIVTIWNYKNGPAYNGGEGSIEELDYFSAYFSNKAFFDYIQSLIVARPMDGEE
jgi:hypothetical protein